MQHIADENRLLPGEWWRRCRPQRWIILGAVTLGVAAPRVAGQEAGSPPGLDLPVVDDTLPNGMRFLVLRRPGPPTASFVLRFDVGSVNETSGETGIAHFLEHLLFKGTTTIGTKNLKRERALFPRLDSAEASLAQAEGLGADSSIVSWLLLKARALQDSAKEVELPNEFNRILTENGARNVNATTSYESTTYYMRLPANRAELWFVMEADRMANPVFRDFYTERDVVAEERRSRLETTPSGPLMEAFYSTAYHVHPYGVPVMGYMNDIQSYRRDEVERYHRRFYGPSNAVAAVVGDVDPQQVLEWARKYFGPIPAGERPGPVTAEEPEQKAERRVDVVFDAEPQVVIGWHVSSGYDPDMPALQALSQLLTGGKTSRLYKRLVVEDKLAAWVTASIGPAFRDPLLFTVSAQPLAGVGTRRLEAAIYDELDRLRREPPTAQEFQRVRNQLEVADVQRLTSNLGLAFQLVESEAYYGDWRETFRSGGRVSAVTPADVQRVVDTYLTSENRTVATMARPAKAGASTGHAR